MSTHWSPAMLWRYQKERFPLVTYMLLILLTLAAAGADKLSFADLAVFIPAFVLFMLFFFRLRLFDEIKDYDIDRKYRPERIVARGEVSLKTITVWLAVTVVLELLLLFFLPAALVFWYLVAVAWSVLMYVEFFVPEWLNKRFLLYGFIHVIVMFPLALAMRATFGVEEVTDETGLWIAAAITGVSYIFEVSRKIWRPSEEREGVDSYSSRIGIKASVLLFMILIAVVHLSFSMAYPNMMTGLLIFGAISLLFFPAYILGTGKPLYKKLELISGLYMMGLYAGIIIAQF